MQTQADTESTSFRLFQAIESGETETVRALLREDPRLATARNKDGASALIWATYYRRRPICEILLANGVTANVFEAAALGLDDHVSELLRGDRSIVHAYSYDGWTPLHLAAHFGRTEVMRTLLANGADHRAVSRNSNRNQPLQAAAAGNRLAAVELLLKAGADVDARSHGRFTALHIAAENGNPQMVTVLLAAGADVRAASEGGKTALDFAIGRGSPETVAALEHAGATR